jgi:predicted nucleic acid-binding protein
MHIVDSCGWLEWFSDGKLVEHYGAHLKVPERILVPVVVFYEVYKILKREIGEEKALMAAGHMKRSTIVPLDEILALQAADLSLKHQLAMADAQVYATAVSHNCLVYTSDVDLKGLPLVHFVAESSAHDE